MSYYKTILPYIARTVISPVERLFKFLAKFRRSSAKQTFSNLELNKSGVSKMCVFQPLSRRYSENLSEPSTYCSSHSTSVRDMAKVAIYHNKKSYKNFQMT